MWRSDAPLSFCAVLRPRSSIDCTYRGIRSTLSFVGQYAFRSRLLYSPLLLTRSDGGPPRVVVNDRAPHLSKLVDPVLLFMMMGRELFPLLEVPAGMVVGLGNLQQQVIKSATLSSTPACPSFSRLRFQVRFV